MPDINLKLAAETAHSTFSERYQKFVPGPITQSLMSTHKAWRGPNLIPVRLRSRLDGAQKQTGRARYHLSGEHTRDNCASLGLCEDVVYLAQVLANVQHFADKKDLCVRHRLCQEEEEKESHKKEASNKEKKKKKRKVLSGRMFLRATALKRASVVWDLWVCYSKMEHSGGFLWFYRKKIVG
ncbi:hypothetical protein CEXT_474781 [Caerostris extrusa]|uniref:Uncharacterized protein n=1 Tax=Caerostris extrusa TaxID=172846 RepID=A0AAV4T6V1_CAEEX|nr:hypothetical protein CEXT_474781 [Caerostris extrusa]